LSKQALVGQEQEFRAEAERLALPPRQDQRKILGMLRECADNPKTPKRERNAGLARIRALERHLRRLNRRAESPMTLMSPLVIHRSPAWLGAWYSLASAPEWHSRSYRIV
jgi:hypothetical protein